MSAHASTNGDDPEDIVVIQDMEVPPTMECLYKLVGDSPVHNQELLESLCNQIGNRPVAVISTGGKSRFGKTFWQNILLKGLQIGDPKFQDHELIGGYGGIPFRKGFGRDTVGLNVWPEVFTRTDVHGNEIAVILMDTQGTFDNQSEVDESINYFSTSLLLSSIQIFNVNSKLDATDFESLSSFIEYSDMSGDKVGQHFMFLVRDALEGHGLSPDFLENLLGGAKSAPRLYQLIAGCYYAFEKVDSFLVVPPENAVRSADGEIEAGRCGREFLNLMCDAARHVLKSLRPKCVMGGALNGASFLQYTQGVFKEMESKNRCKIGSFYTAFKQLSLETARNAGLELFRDLWNKESTFEILKPEEFRARSQLIWKQALQAYQAVRRHGTQKELADALGKFEAELQEKVQAKWELNAEKHKAKYLTGAIHSALRVYNKAIQPEMTDCLRKEVMTINDVQDSHRRAMKEALNSFQESCSEYCATDYDTVLEKKAQLVELLEDRLNDALHQNTQEWIKTKGEELVERRLVDFDELLKLVAPQILTEDEAESAMKDAKETLETTWELAKTELLEELANEQPNLPVEAFEKYLDSLYSGSLARGLKASETQFWRTVDALKRVRQMEEEAEQKRLEHEENVQQLTEEIQKLSADANALKSKDSNDRLKLKLMKMEAEQKEKELQEKWERLQEAEKSFKHNQEVGEGQLRALRRQQQEQMNDHQRQCQEEAERLAIERAEEKKLQEGLRVFQEAKMARLQKEKDNVRCLLYNSEPAIGIDLGTTYSAVAICLADEVVMIPNEYGNKTTPSQVAYINDKILVGQAAKNQAARNSGNTIYEVKRLMGKTFKDPTVQANMTMRPFKVINAFGDPVIEVKQGDKVHTVTPVEVSTQLLTKLKEMAGEYLGKPVKKAVITVPAYFNDAQRQATKEAAEQAGLEVLRLLNEPTAAAIAYGVDYHLDEERIVLVYDFGGGTLDISIVRMTSTKFEIMATSGNPNLGGEDINNALLNYCLSDMEDKVIKEDSRAWARLRLACEEAKIQLSAAKEAWIEVPSLLLDFDYSKKITREFYEGICATLFEESLLPVEHALRDAKLRYDDVHEVVFVGGSSNIPKVQEMLLEKFPKAGCWMDRPEEMVVCGAALQAARLVGNCNETIRCIDLIDVIPLTIGSGMWGGETTVLFKRNTSFPVKKTLRVHNASDYQEQACITVVEGERFDYGLNNLLGKFMLPIRKAKQCEVQIDVTYEIDQNGILTVEAEELLEGTHESIKIDREKLGKKSVFNISHYLKNWKQCEEEDRTFRNNVSALVKYRDTAHGLMWLTNPRAQHLSVDGKRRIKELGIAAYEWVQANRYRPDAEEFHRRTIDLEFQMNQIMG